MVDINQVKNAASKFLNDATRKLRQVAPTQLSSEKKFINASAAALALMVVADGKVETDEVVQAIDFISSLDPVTELNMQREAVVFFEKYIDELSSSLETGNQVKFMMMRGQVLGDIALVKDYPQYAAQIQNMVELTTSGGGAAPKELEMKKAILGSLGLSA